MLSAMRTGKFTDLPLDHPDRIDRSGEDLMQCVYQEWTHFIEGERNLLSIQFTGETREWNIRWDCGQWQTARLVGPEGDTLATGTIRELIIQANRERGQDFQPGGCRYSPFVVFWPHYKSEMTDEDWAHLRNDPVGVAAA